MSDELKGSQTGPTNDPEHFRESAADRAHGTHGKGDSREVLHDTPNAAAADGSKDSSIRGGGVQGGTAGWGSEGAGGSTVERRSEPRGKDKKKKR
jgi:hypothetical protein